ncbi:MAG: SusC/RagA family TonB-linked outer membrane protein [Candidatus Pedobacter colombiensis]|uniref:SusC/RagA family TonB-linked outer membrane protein n=1 Tax=Candidatus Pedobacter colombiensis TaxID=3121371 RepID=A0AAJ5W5U7_9SPHI|nr:SusC/RagA family TonB-linked outer membrane protein [Pedobacter sp.]WEK17816.1 MAG: SusC/RagA family TonB-linked outer membrane protein [Pedobacter sp.]
MKSKLLMLLMACCVTLSSYAQSIVKGKVLDELGKGLPGATVALKDSKVRTITNNNGEFGIGVPNLTNAILEVSYIGYMLQVIEVGGKNNLTIRLKPNPASLNEVVVTALGIKRDAKSLGYSRQGVDVDELTEARDPNIINMLSGKVAGLQIVTSGQPTGSTRVVLRGPSSLTGNNEPLWVVDGIPIDNSSGQNGNLDYGSGASVLNPDDIESLEVLKGPNAAALYGSMAANGAILVTTKKGKVSKNFGISVNSNFMASTITELPAYQNVYGEGNAGRFVQDLNNIDPTLGVYMMGKTDRSWGAPMLGQPYASFSGAVRTYIPQPGNVEDLYHSSLTGIQNISVSKADNASSFRLSYTFTNGHDVLEKQNIVNKHNIALNASRVVKPYLRIETSLQYANEDVKNRTYRNMDNNSPMNAYIFMIRSLSPSDLTPWEDANGNSFNYTNKGGFENQYWSINENSNGDRRNRLIGGITAILDINKDLKFRAKVATDMLFGTGFTYVEKGGAISKTGSYSEFTQNNSNWNKEGLLMYNKKLSKFSISANLGGNLRTSNNYRTDARTTALAVHKMISISNTSVTPLASEQLDRTAVNSVFGTATFGYNDYLFVDVTGRNDWSSTLPKANRSFFYPSVSGSFLFGDYFKLPKDIISFGKVRASIARVGNATSANNLISAFNYGGNFLGNSWVAMDTKLKNPNLKPEQTTSAEVGLELKFLKGRIALDATAYKSSSVNQIFEAAVPVESGFSRAVLNAGEIQNKGLEFTLGATAVKTRDFSWNVNANWSMNKNKVVSLTPGIDRFQLGGWWQMSVNADVGMPIGSIRGNDQYRASTGEVIIKSDSGQPYYDQNVYLGNFLPKWLGSFGSTFRYKNFDLNFNFSIKMGGDIYSVGNHKANVAGNTIASLQGREEFLFSTIILGESGTEQKGVTQLYGLPYPDANRSKGMKFDGYYPKLDASGKPILDANGRMVPGEKADYNVSPQAYWQYMDYNMHVNIFDASYIKLNQFILGYNFPSKIFSKTPFQTARIALVGRNLWTILKHTPNGIDPESANSSGNAQGIEQGGSLPYATYGVDFKFTF